MNVSSIMSCRIVCASNHDILPVTVLGEGAHRSLVQPVGVLVPDHTGTQFLLHQLLWVDEHPHHSVLVSCFQCRAERRAAFVHLDAFDLHVAQRAGMAGRFRHR